MFKLLKKVKKINKSTLINSRKPSFLNGLRCNGDRIAADRSIGIEACNEKIFIHKIDERLQAALKFYGHQLRIKCAVQQGNNVAVPEAPDSYPALADVSFSFYKKVYFRFEFSGTIGFTEVKIINKIFDGNDRCGHAVGSGG